MNEKLCRLCLNTISESDFQLIGNLKDILNELLLNLNLDISNEAVMCCTCARNLQIYSNFTKSTGVLTEDSKLIFTDIKINKAESENIQTNINSVETKICHFCRKIFGIWDYISLNETKENTFLVEMLQKHFPEWNLNYTDELLTCYICLDSLRSLLNFIMTCLNVEEKIKAYIKMKGTNGGGQIELNDVQKFTFKPISKSHACCNNVAKMNEGDDKFEENINVESETEIKIEEHEVNYTNLNIKSEELDIVFKEDDCERFDDGIVLMPPTNLRMSPESVTWSVEGYLWKPHIEPISTNEEHKNKKMYQCNSCTFKTKSKHYLNSHLLNHKDPSGVTKYRCETCSYQTKHKCSLKRHLLLLHKDPSEVPMYSCHCCTFQTKNKHYLNIHFLKHKDLSEVQKYKCDSCSFQTKYKIALKTHSLTHKSSSEVRMYKCDSCSFQAKYKSCYNRHLLVHKTTSEVTMYNCDFCSFETKHKNYLKAHLLVHKDYSEVTMYNCDTCSFQTKRKHNLKAHLLLHKVPSEITMYDCDVCSFQTKYRRSIKAHVLQHKSPSEVTLYQCDSCLFQTRQKHNLNRHLRVHKDPSEVTMYQCASCPFQARRKDNLKVHVLEHKSS